MASSQGISWSIKEGSALDTLPVYVKELMAGGVAGGFSKSAVAPLERIKILVQTRTEGYHSMGVRQSLKRLLKHEGFAGFYKGNGASVIRIIPYSSLYFMTYERYKCWMLDNYAIFRSGPLVDLLAGSAAGGTAILCTYPLDLARTILAHGVVDAKASLESGSRNFIAQPRNSGIKSVLGGVYRESGVRGLYRGIGPTLMAILPYAGMRFCIYEELKRHVSEEHQRSIVMSLSCGALSGLLGQSVTYPLDVVKRQMQVDSGRYKNTWKAFTTIVSEQGWRQLFAGLGINYIKIVPSMAIGFATYDMMKLSLRIPPRQKTKSASTV
ncbi:putative mitochondrial carrier domain protein [Helianthus annuus]|uniref:Mitochondrial carrier domain protein n=1 Tax=Helianthus annuus TaxID=4232 RepID=A0A9K3JGR0_HELAN|nr:mitochondrial carrier protein CoAc1 [Helianthus annuus]KAF5815336.1 putative mitochondrial carrier domain protein [Helianthus annuus]